MSRSIQRATSMTSEPTPGQTPGPDPQPELLQYTDGGAYAPAAASPPRPASVTVVACIGIVLGALGLFCKPASLAVFVIKMPFQHPVVEAIRNDSFIRGSMIVSAATGWVISLLLLLASVGSLRL